MDLQTVLNNMMAAKRADDMLNSEQLTVAELILKLGAVKNKELPVVFDDGKYRPCGLSSWRGSYAELAFTYAEVGKPLEDEGCSYNGDEVVKEYPEYGITIYNDIPATLPEKPTVKEVIELLERVKGKTFTGYKGGDFTMGKSTPLWVANYGDSSGYREEEGDKYLQGVVDVLETPEVISIVTQLLAY